ncbi:MAG TPA: glycosyltransferase [Bacteroidia bacterium]|nr:glycosyltransferase [Bacteroidia bacterium]
MKLSVIIINYNVKYFLEQCLLSVFKALDGIAGEVIVVDNNSVDGSVEMLKKKISLINLIANSSNEGFSKANNRGIRQSKGEYILLLNPDTVVEENTFRKVLQFMDEHADAGALGVKMIDGSGKFLPESKRGLPTPAVAFYKISGLAKLFPHSRTFGKYHLSFLGEDKINRVDVLSGACMFIRKSVLEKSGLLDEDYFMYGEDIDLSYRIQKAGFYNYYFPEARIIHYKGESTKKTSVNYVFMFYRAMIVFARKHFSSGNAFWFSFLINTAIYFRAAFAIAGRIWKKFFFPFLDAALLFSGIYLLQVWWSKNLAVNYPSEFFIYVLPSYIVIWLTTIFFSGGYDAPVRISKIVRGIVTGTLIILVIYALLPETYRFSRALILLGAVWAIISTASLRLLLNLLPYKIFSLASGTSRRLLIAGSAAESKRVLSLLNLTGTRTNFIGFADAEKNNGSTGDTADEDFQRYHLGSINRLGDIAEVYRADEIIFCAADIPSRTIIASMSQITGREIDFKIAPPESMYIIGSRSIDNPGELYVVDVNAISRPVNRRNKRVLDLAASVFFFLASPLLLFFQKRPAGFYPNVFNVITGKKTWVGYSANHEIQSGKSFSGNALPSIRSSVFSTSDIIASHVADIKNPEKLDQLYAKDYHVSNDVRIILKNWRELGVSR